MKKYLVIGNPIDHSFSPKLHNYWIKKNNIDAVYEKKKISKLDLENIISDIKKEKINGVNVTVPFKKDVIPYLDLLSQEAEDTQSVNTIYLQNGNPMVSSDNIANEVRKLNTMVIDYCAEQVTIQVTQYEGYLDKLKTLPVPIEHPRQVDRNNYTYDISNLL